MDAYLLDQRNVAVGASRSGRRPKSWRRRWRPQAGSPGRTGLWLGDVVALRSCGGAAKGLRLGDAAAGLSRGAAIMGRRRKGVEGGCQGESLF
jgi:hypothetical protein